MQKKIIKFGCIALLAIVLLGALLYFVPYTEKADFSLQGTAYKLERQEDPDSEETAPCTIRFEGRIRHYLFKQSELKGTLTVESDFHTYTADFFGPYYSVSLGTEKENANWTMFQRYQANVNRAVAHTLAFTDDRKTAFVNDWEEDYYYCVSSLPEEQAQEIYDQYLDFFKIN